MKKMHSKILLLMIILISSAIFIINPLLKTENQLDSRVSAKSTIPGKKTPTVPLTSAWIDNGTAICTEPNEQLEISICSDDEGGAILVWSDRRTGMDNWSLYAQRINSTGDIQWTSFPDGVPIWENTSTGLIGPQICSDGEGGAIIVWSDNRTGDSARNIYGQKINSNGELQWGTEGVVICDSSGLQWSPEIISVTGGFIIAWTDYINGNGDIFAQKINSDGIRLWYDLTYGYNGKPVCTNGADQLSFEMCSDGAGGAIITWEDLRYGWDNLTVYAQRMDFNGNPYWLTDGIPICLTSNIILMVGAKPKICSDNNGGAIIAWTDNRTGGIDIYTDIYIQRVNSTGDTQWEDQGIAVCTAPLAQSVRDIVSDGANGAIIVWRDNRNGPYRDIYAQRINSTGDIQWSPDGAEICKTNWDKSCQICSDGLGGAFIAWTDERNGYDEADIYAQYINDNGIKQWNDDGAIICNENNRQSLSSILCNTPGSIIVVWRDDRTGFLSGDIYAQRIKNAAPTSNHPGTIVTSMSDSETIDWIIYDDNENGQYRVLTNNSAGEFFTWVDWTSWTNNTPIYIPINRYTPGVYNYTIEFYDDFGQYGTPDMSIVTILDKMSIDLVNQSFSTEVFNITFNLTDWLGHSVIYDMINILWDGEPVPSGDIETLQPGLIHVKLTPKTIAPGEAQILLNISIFKSGFQDLNYQISIGVDPETIDKAPKPSIPFPSGDDDDDGAKEEEGPTFAVLGIVFISIGAAIGTGAVVIFLIKKRKLSK